MGKREHNENANPVTEEVKAVATEEPAKDFMTPPIEETVKAEPVKDIPKRVGPVRA